ncbi:hypothetical protein Tco_1435282, partial [Tanacetum coccineum]
IISSDVADVDNNPIIDKFVVMLEDKQPSISYDKEVNGNHEARANPSTRNSEYAKAPQVKVNFGTSSDAEKAFVSDFNNLKMEKIPEVVENTQSKGFRRLLKLGKQNHSPSDTLSANATSDNGTFTAPDSASTEVLLVVVLLLWWCCGGAVVVLWWWCGAAVVVVIW